MIARAVLLTCLFALSACATPPEVELAAFPAIDSGDHPTRARGIGVALVFRK